MKSKLVFGLVLAMVILALAPSSYAQVNLQIFPNASQQEIQTDRTARTADPTSAGAGLLVSGALVANSPLTTTSLFIDYPSAITSGPAAVLVGETNIVPPTDPIRIEGATGVFAAAAISTINFTTGVVQLTLPGFDTASNTLSGSFRLVGVRVDANGLTAPVAGSFSLSNTANNYILSTTSGTVINALGAGLASVAVGGRASTSTNLGTATIFTNRNLADSAFSFVVTEGFASAWRSITQNTTNGSAAPNGHQIRLTFAGIPTGVTLPISITDLSSTLTVTADRATVTSTNSVLVVTITGSSLTATEAFQVDTNPIAVSSTASLSTGSITVTATMAPIGAALSSVNTPTDNDGFPKFAQSDVGPVTVVSIVSAQTNLLVPFAVRDGAFDTGISLSNTTADPFGTAGGGTTPTAGAVRLDFFPRSAAGGAGTAFSLTTSSTVRPGIGLSSDGTLAAGTTWTVLLSELLTSAGQTGSFTGYIFIQTSFPNAHGAPFVSDFRNFTSFTPMLVLAPPATTSRQAGVVEALHF